MIDIKTFFSLNCISWIPSYTEDRLFPGKGYLLTALCPKGKTWYNTTDRPGVVLRDQHIQSEFVPDCINEICFDYPKDIKGSRLFLSTGDDSLSPFPVHNDITDVMIICFNGSLELEEWHVDPSEVAHIHKENNEFLPDAGIGRIVKTYTLSPGDAAVIPRGVFHHIIPSSDRISWTLGFHPSICD